MSGLSGIRDEYMDVVVEVATGKIDAEADPEKMSQDEALIYYRSIASHCETWIENIERDLGIKGVAERRT